MSAEAKLSIGQIIRNAIVFNPQNWHRGAMNTDTLLQDVVRFFALLDTKRIKFVLVGGIAMRQYVPSRNTEDLDLIVASTALKKLPELDLIDQDANFARARFDQLQIDFLLTRNRLFDKVRRKYTVIRSFEERDVPCATVDGLLLLKLYALPSLHRQGNFQRLNLYEGDIAALLFDYRPKLEPLFVELAPYVSDTDLTAIKDIAAEIQQRIERFQKLSTPAAQPPVGSEPVGGRRPETETLC